MIKRIVSALVAALSFSMGQKTQTKALQDAIKERDRVIQEQKEQIEALLAAIEDENKDDASLEEAAATARAAQETAEKDKADLQAQLDDLNKQLAEAADTADNLLSSIHSDDEIPVSVVDGKVKSDWEPPTSTEPKAEPQSGEKSETETEEDEEVDDLDTTVDELKAIAEKEEVDLTGITLKADIQDAIRKARSEK